MSTVYLGVAVNCAVKRIRLYTILVLLSNASNITSNIRQLNYPKRKGRNDKKPSASNYTPDGCLLFGGGILPIPIVVGKRRHHRAPNIDGNSLYV